MKKTYVVCENRYLNGEFVWCNVWGTADRLVAAAKALKDGVPEMENLFTDRKILREKLFEGKDAGDNRFEIDFEGGEHYSVTVVETKELA